MGIFGNKADDETPQEASVAATVPEQPKEPDPVVTSVEEANQPPEGVSAGPDHGDADDGDKDAKADPKPYRSTEDVYIDNVYVKAGDPFVTSADKSDKWTEIPQDAFPAAVAAANKVPPDSSLENLDVAALQAIAFMKNVMTAGIEGDKDALMTAIKAAYEPSL